ncbi:MAG: photosystem II manganese-stabilizing polypeptide [Synechococcales bacterium]|nr:photosystem II manganese-stabilizing polypeptide [Synechococcales bacterium]
MRYRALVAAFLALCLGFLTACSEGSMSADRPLTYDEIRGTGLANTCPRLSETRRGAIPVSPSESYVIRDLCLEPTAYFVKEEPTNKRQEAEYVPAKALTRYTSSLDQVTGDLAIGEGGELVFSEKDGFDFQPITVQLPGGEQVPFLFTVKGLTAKALIGSEGINTSTDFEGDFRVPSYRTSNFLDPKGRGLATGYDNAIALPAQADREELLKENVKKFETGSGHISLQIAKVDSYTGEVAGTFESEQPSDTDMGADEALDVKVQGVFYGRIEPAA